MTPEELDRLERLCAAATPPPWSFRSIRNENDRLLVCAARTALPDLIAEVRRLTDQSAELYKLQFQAIEDADKIASSRIVIRAQRDAALAKVERLREALKTSDALMDTYIEGSVAGDEYWLAASAANAAALAPIPPGQPK